MKSRILVVEDEENIRELLALNLEMEGHIVVTCGTGIQALRAFKEEKFDLVVLDIMLPEMSGLEVCEGIRLQNAEVPILFLSARGSSEDKVLGLKKGGDDYLSKPFNLEELLLRVTKLLERTKYSSVETTSIGLKEYSFEYNYVNFESFEAKGVNGNFILTKKEALLLKLLVENENEVISRERILHTVWGYSVYPSTRTIDNFILSFRKYFETDPKHPTHFISLRGVGYKFIP